MTQEEYDDITRMIEFHAFQYCERHKMKITDRAEYKEGLRTALEIIKGFIETPLNDLVIEGQNLRKTLLEIEDRCSRDNADIPSYVKALFVLVGRLCDNVIKHKFDK